jgi:hypothetical protein
MKPILITLAKLLLRLAIDKALQQALPKIYGQLDAELPPLLYNQAPPEAISFRIGRIVRSITKERFSNSTIEIVKMLYDPTKVNKQR